MSAFANTEDVAENIQMVVAMNNAPLYFNAIEKGSLISGSSIWNCLQAQFKFQKCNRKCAHQQ